MTDFVKFIITIICSVVGTFCLGTLMYCLFHFGVDYQRRTEERLEKRVKIEAMNGNEFAMCLVHERYFKVNYKDRDIVQEALKGNIRAMKVLGIEYPKGEKK